MSNNVTTKVCVSNLKYCHIRIESGQLCQMCMAGYEVIDGECVKSVDGCEQLNWFGCGVCNSQFVNANFVCVPRFCDIYNTNKPNQC